MKKQKKQFSLINLIGLVLFFSGLTVLSCYFFIVNQTSFNFLFYLFFSFMVVLCCFIALIKSPNFKVTEEKEKGIE